MKEYVKLNTEIRLKVSDSTSYTYKTMTKRPKAKKKGFKKVFTWDLLNDDGVVVLMGVKNFASIQKNLFSSFLLNWVQMTKN